jgi:hypothetical protein
LVVAVAALATEADSGKVWIDVAAAAARLLTVTVVLPKVRIVPASNATGKAATLIDSAPDSADAEVVIV